MDPAAFVDSLGGFASRRECVDAGLDDRLLRALLDDGVLGRPRRGWYSTRRSTNAGFRAVAAGGRLTGVSALAEYGAWAIKPSLVLHVAVPVHGNANAKSDVILHWTDGGAGGTRSAVSIGDALVRVVLDEDLETAAVSIDWALSSGRLDRIAFESMLNALPDSARGIRAWVDHRSQSLLETVARVRLLRRGWSVRSQTRVGQLQHIDLVVEDAVALELDGRRFHETT